MSENPRKKPDFLDLAKSQFAQIAAEFEKALETLKDPERRKQMTSSYLDLLQKGLTRAQDSVTKYQEKVAPHPKTAPEATPPPDFAAPTDHTPGPADPGPAPAGPSTS